VFNHFIFIVEGSLKEFDPLRDLLLDPYTYLTWRRVDQDTPASNNKIYGAVYRPYKPANSWGVVRFDLTTASFPGVESWIRRSAQVFPGRRLSLYQSSKYKGLFTPIHSGVKEAKDIYREKSALLCDLLEVVELPPFFPIPAEPLAPKMAWESLRKDVIDRLLEFNRAAEAA